jgi:hypothetical protein
MAFLINPGGEDDKDSIDLATLKGNRIPNWQKGERAPEAMQAALGVVMDGHDGRVLRSLASTYNCIGMAFANRRTCIEPEQVPTILKEDGFVEVPQAAAVVTGDLVVYELDGDISHVALVVSNAPDLADGSSNIRVLSQWGFDGEYLHDYRDVHPSLGRPVQFYSERRKI